MPLLRAGALLVAVLPTAVALTQTAWAQTRDEIRQRDEQLYEQQQQQQQQEQPTAPPLGDTGDAGAPPPSYPSGGAAGGGLTAQLLDRVNRLEDQVRTLQGRVDVLQNQLQTQTATLNKQIGDLSFAAQQGGGQGAGLGRGPSPAAAVAPQAAAPAAPPPAVHHTPEMALRDANIALAHRDYAGAADLARQAGAGVHAAQAQYVLGEALTGQGNHGGAAAAFYTAYQKQPHGPLAADALLHVGVSLIATGDTNAACEALAQLRDVPGARPGTLKSAGALRARARCH